jgi:hypothetical protein
MTAKSSTTRNRYWKVDVILETSVGGNSGSVAAHASWTYDTYLDPDFPI